MNTLIKAPLARKKVPRKNYSIPQNHATLKVVHKEFLKPKSNFNNVTDLFKGNADFINYGISAMSNLF